MSKKPENPFRTLFHRVYDYFTYNVVRRVFFFALAAVLITAICMQIFGGSQIVFGVFLFCAVVATVSLMIDIILRKRAFVEQMRSLETDSIERIYEREGEEGLAGLKTVFSPLEIRIMRKKKRDFNFMILATFIFAVILVVIFVDMF